ncbi:MAG: pilus assembly protein TadG-related protein [Phascolarctobacterium sp.]
MNKNYLYTKFKNAQRGAIMVLFAVLLPVLFGFMGFSIDLGLAYVEHGKMQDIADAAALAGAAHLGDSDRDTTVKDAVKAYVEANGIKLGANDLVNRVDGSAWDAKDTLAKGQDALVSYSIVSVTKDGETRDRVRVRITKRAPLFFFNVLGDFSDGLVVAAKAAAEGGSEGQIATVKSENPVFMCRGFSYNYLNANQIVIPAGSDFSVYMRGTTGNLSMLPGSGIVYANDINGNGVQFGYDFETKDIYFDPPLPNDRYWVCTSTGGTAVGWGVYRNYPPGGSEGEALKLAEKEAKEAELLALQKEINDKYDAFVQEGRDTIKAVESKLDDYKNNVGNKRYIGFDNNGKVINTIQPGDDNIELYVDSTYGLYYHNDYYYYGSPYGEHPPADVKESEGSLANNVNVLTNFALKDVKTVSKLFMSSSRAGVLATNGIKYGDVYFANSLSDISGSNNSFGSVYNVNKDANKDWGSAQLWIGGNDNHYAGSADKPAFVSDNNLYFGKVHRGVYFEEITAPDGTKKQIVQANVPAIEWGQDPNWKIYIDMDSKPSDGSSGSEGGTTTTKLRLVE